MHEVGIYGEVMMYKLGVVMRFEDQGAGKQEFPFLSQGTPSLGIPVLSVEVIPSSQGIHYVGVLVLLMVLLVVMVIVSGIVWL